MKNFFSVLTFVSVSLFAFAAMASGENDTSLSAFRSWAAIAAAFSMAIACIGGAFGQSKVATAAMEGIARNPEAAGKIITPMIISLALIESLVIYALVIAFMIQGKI